MINRSRSLCGDCSSIGTCVCGVGIATHHRVLTAAVKGTDGMVNAAVIAVRMVNAAVTAICTSQCVFPKPTASLEP